MGSGLQGKNIINYNNMNTLHAEHAKRIGDLISEFCKNRKLWLAYLEIHGEFSKDKAYLSFDSDYSFEDTTPNDKRELTNKLEKTISFYMKTWCVQETIRISSEKHGWATNCIIILFVDEHKYSY